MNTVVYVSFQIMIFPRYMPRSGMALVSQQWWHTMGSYGSSIFSFLRNFPTVLHKYKVKLFSCIWLCDPIDCSLPGSSIHGIFLARVLEWVAISFSREFSQPRDWTWVSHIAGRRFTVWATREAQTPSRNTPSIVISKTVLRACQFILSSSCQNLVNTACQYPWGIK